MSRPFRLGLIQVPDRLPDDGYLARTNWMLAEAEKAFSEGAELVFLPEAYQYALDRSILFRPEEFHQVSNAYKEKCAALARKYHAYFVPWDYEIDEAGNRYNTAYILDRDGKEIGRHRKVHLTYGEQNTLQLTNGNDFAVFDLDFGKVGILICWDNYFPESARILGLRGADIILYPLYGDTLNPGWQIKARARAIDNAAYMAPCCISTLNDVFTGLIAPDGTVISRVEGSGTHTVVTVYAGREVQTHTCGNPAITEDIRKLVSRCRRPMAYTPLTEALPLPTWEEVYDDKFPS